MVRKTKGAKAQKLPKIDPRNQPNLTREPKIRALPKETDSPVWRISEIDWDGPWCLSKCNPRDLLSRLAHFESMSWTQIQSGTGSHVVGAEGISKQARERLLDLKKEQWADHLCSLRMSGKERFWGFLRAGIFHVLWWDPKHQVYASKKKHT